MYQTRVHSSTSKRNEKGNGGRKNLEEEEKGEEEEDNPPPEGETQRGTRKNKGGRSTHSWASLIAQPGTGHPRTLAPVFLLLRTA